MNPGRYSYIWDRSNSGVWKTIWKKNWIPIFLMLVEINVLIYKVQSLHALICKGKINFSSKKTYPCESSSIVQTLKCLEWLGSGEVQATDPRESVHWIVYRNLYWDTVIVILAFWSTACSYILKIIYWNRKKNV